MPKTLLKSVGCIRSSTFDGNAMERLRALISQEANDGRQLAENIEDNQICAITIDASVPCVMVKWKRYATSFQLRFAHEAILDLLVKNRLQKILGDDTDLP